MTKEIISAEIVDSLYEELQSADLELWNEARELAIKKHLVRGEILRRYEKQFKIDVTATVAVMAEKGISEKGLWNSLKIFDEHWKGDIETSLAQLPEGKNMTVRKLLGVPEKEKDELCAHFCSNHAKLFGLGKTIGGGKL